MLNFCWMWFQAGYERNTHKVLPKHLVEKVKNRKAISGDRNLNTMDNNSKKRFRSNIFTPKPTTELRRCLPKISLCVAIVAAPKGAQ